MGEWKAEQFYNDGHTEYTTQIGDFQVTVVEILNHTARYIPNHWGYTIKHPNGYYATGHRFPWSAERAMNYTILVLSLRAISKVLLEKSEYYPTKWLYDEDDLDRV